MTPTPNFDPIVYVVDDDPAVLDSVSLLIRTGRPVPPGPVLVPVRVQW